MWFVGETYNLDWLFKYHSDLLKTIFQRICSENWYIMCINESNRKK